MSTDNPLPAVDFTAFGHGNSVTFLHGSTSAALAIARVRGQFLPRAPGVLAHDLATEFNLSVSSLLNSQYFEFRRLARANDPNLYLTQDLAIAEEYARAGSESVEDALRAVWSLQHPGDKTYLSRKHHPRFRAFHAQWCLEHEHEPLVLVFELPLALLERCSDYREYRTSSIGRRERLDVDAWLLLSAPVNTLRLPFALDIKFLTSSYAPSPAA